MKRENNKSGKKARSCLWNERFFFTFGRDVTREKNFRANQADVWSTRVNFLSFEVVPLRFIPRMTFH